MQEDLFAIIQSGDAARLAPLLGADPALAGRENADGMTPLGYAAHFGRAEAVSVLLAAGADVNAVSHSRISYIPSNTALHAAIAGERSLEVIALLLESGADPNILDSNGHTSLHVAAYHVDRPEIVDLLVRHGADVAAKTSEGATAVSIAAERGHLQAAARLRELGAEA